MLKHKVRRGIEYKAHLLCISKLDAADDVPLCFDSSDPTNSRRNRLARRSDKAKDDSPHLGTKPHLFSL